MNQLDVPQKKRRKKKANKTQSLQPSSNQNQSDQINDSHFQQQLQSMQPAMAHCPLSPQASMAHFDLPQQPQQQLLPMNLTTNQSIKYEQAPERYNIINPEPYDTGNVCKTGKYPNHRIRNRYSI